jgi:hypothetical protein
MAIRQLAAALCLVVTACGNGTGESTDATPTVPPGSDLAVDDALNEAAGENLPLGDPPAYSTVDPTPLEPLNPVASDPPTDCDFDGFVYELTIRAPNGAAIREAPSLAATEIASIESGTEVSAFWESETETDGITWTAAWADDEVGCGWLAVHGEPTFESPCPGAGYPGTVTGVAEWVNIRSAPGLSAAIATLADANSQLMYFPETVEESDNLGWVGVDNVVPGVCSYVAMMHVKGDDGRVLLVNARSYLTRALFGLEPEAMHATMQLTSPEEMSPFSDDVLRPGLATLARIGSQHPDLDILPIPWEDPQPWNEPGCFVSHGSVCTFRLVDRGIDIATVEVQIYGNGITSLIVEEG